MSCNVQISQHEVEAARAVDVRDLWRRLNLPALPSRGNIRSPFRPDEHPTCEVGGAKNIFHDYGTGETLDTIALVQKARGGGFQEAVGFILDRPQGSPNEAAPIPADPIEDLARRRGWTVTALKALGCSASDGEVRFPMRDAAGNVIGWRRRRGDNSKFAGADTKALATKGSKNGLICPWPLPADAPVVVTEGETDIAAALSAGWSAVIATPGATPGRECLVQLKRVLVGRDVILVPDPDAAGRRWLEEVGTALANTKCQVRFIPAESVDLDARLKGETDKLGVLTGLISGAIPFRPSEPVLASALVKTVPKTLPMLVLPSDIVTIDDFDFVSPGDRSRALAALITPALRLGGFMDLAPIDIAEADQSQAGKGFRQKLTAAIYNEEPQIVAQRSGGVGSFDETLAEQLFRGRPFIQLDNLRSKVDSPYLEAFMTAGSQFPIRIPYHGQVLICPQSFVMMATSNSVELTVDLANRSSITRIRKRPESYPYRRFPEGDLLDHVKANQAHYLGCVFSVIKAWIEAERPQTDENGHDFRQWARSLDWIVQQLFKAAPLLAGHREARQRASDPGLTFTRALAFAIEKTGALGQAMNASDLYELAENEGIMVPGLREPNAHQGPRQVGISLGRVLGGKDSAEVDGFVIALEMGRAPRPDGKGYFDVKLHRFTRASHSPETANP